MARAAISAEWWRGAVIYQIYPLSFRDSDGDGKGDLAGVVEKLDYVAGLGVDGIWLSPFFASPMKDFGYDVSDYKAVDPRFGTLADFDAVVARAHALGLKVIIDQVWSHTSEAHPWFIESAASRENPCADWYVWADAREDGTPPNNWQASFGGPSWTWGPRRRQYYLHNFLEAQPDLNFWNEAVQAAILDVARFWLDRGVDGFRLDVVNFLFHNRALTDNPVRPHAGPAAMPTRFQRHVHDRSQPQTLDFIARARGLLDSYGGKMSVGEVVDDPPLPRQIEYTAGNDRLHTAYSFHFLNAARASPELFAEAIAAWAEADGWPSWSLGNHDVARFATRLGGDDPDHVRVLMAALMLLPGTIFLYQGEELGLPQGEVPFERLVDPFAIAAWTGGAGRDGARTPMPWTAEGPSAGFSTSESSWLPLDPRHRPLAAERQSSEPQSMLAFTRELVALRARHRALKLGAARVVAASDGLLAFDRWLEGELLTCLFDLGGRGGEHGAAGEIVWRTPGVARTSAGLRLPPFAAAVIARSPAD
ncbi:MAG TPA: alpha-amylase family glycosyl hydrolase [Caulobacteraceae bacterium]|jgi:alpha-glucosidase